MYDVRQEIFTCKRNCGQMRPICLDLYSLGNNCPASPPNEHLFPPVDTILVHHETAHFLSDMFMCIAFLSQLLVAR